MIYYSCYLNILSLKINNFNEYQSSLLSINKKSIISVEGNKYLLNVALEAPMV